IAVRTKSRSQDGRLVHLREAVRRDVRASRRFGQLGAMAVGVPFLMALAAMALPPELCAAVVGRALAPGPWALLGVSAAGAAGFGVTAVWRHRHRLRLRRVLEALTDAERGEVMWPLR